MKQKNLYPTHYSWIGQIVKQMLEMHMNQNVVLVLNAFAVKRLNSIPLINFTFQRKCNWSRFHCQFSWNIHLSLILIVYFHFRKCIREIYNENIGVLDFGAKPELSRTRINSYVEGITKNHIKDLLPVGSVKTDTNIVLANAAYFKGNWATKFDTENTKKKIFYQHGQLPTYVEMMKQKGNFNYGKFWGIFYVIYR